jgi:anti-anti-sigma factor
MDKTLSIPRIELNGEYDLAQRAQMASLFEALRPDGPAVIDLTKVTYVDAAFLSELIKLRRRFKQHPITLAGAKADVKRVLRLVSFEELFEITE